MKKNKNGQTFVEKSGKKKKICLFFWRDQKYFDFAFPEFELLLLLLLEFLLIVKVTLGG